MLAEKCLKRAAVAVAAIVATRRQHHPRQFGNYSTGSSGSIADFFDDLLATNPAIACFSAAIEIVFAVGHFGRLGGERLKRKIRIQIRP